MTSDQPLIWTTKGNLPVADLRHEVVWNLLPDQIQFIERYWLGDELVKESSHIRILEGAAGLGEAEGK